ncbi:MAG: ABC transporter permease, partial [Bacillota bacterium]|nr:ABC transporter permease [Bacillota bacterium]
VDKMTLQSVIDNQDSTTAGFKTPKDFLEQTVKVSNMPDMTIVGISDLMSPCIYTSQSQFINLLANGKANEDTGMYGMESDPETATPETLIDYNLKSGSVSLKKGAWPVNDYEVLVNEKNQEDMKIGKEISQKVNGQKLKVTGYYSDTYDSDFMLVNNNTIKYKLIKDKANITVCPVDKEASMQQFEDANINVKDTYAESEKSYREMMWASIFSTLIMAGVILAISFIEIFLIIRASFLSRVKEVGVYRAIGVKKNDIYKMFMGEILAITTMASVPGFLFMAYILHKLSGISYFADSFLVTPTVMGICLIAIYGFNLIFGLLPVFRTIRKTPAAILSRTDVN